MHLIDEHYELTFALCDLLEHSLEPLLELAAELRAGDEGTEIQCYQSLVLESFRDISIRYSLRQSFGNRCLAYARLSNQHGIVFCAARQNLDHAANFFIAPNDWIELSFAGGVGEIAV